jgi:hypothetical protein
MNVRAAFLVLALVVAEPALAQSKHLAPGFTALPKGATVAVMPTDIELFSISAGGVVEPRGDWTEAATRHFRAALLAKQQAYGLVSREVSEKEFEPFTEIGELHRAVARAILMHHFDSIVFRLPTKEKQLDWSLGPSVQAIKKATGADYAFFSWVRDSYVSDERKAVMLAMALLFGGGFGGGMQVAYASLVDLDSGRIVWFGDVHRAMGDLRVEDRARETLDTLLTEFPAPQLSEFPIAK